ncbi:hypothetical protein DH2020_038064 [Rehmannia glutinosa]|uniref:Uncharacterized protein n=1 Tax=Rehmannia glutinosa TaxID=99300 RepID=A0ABR0UZM7_REHGL
MQGGKCLTNNMNEFYCDKKGSKEGNSQEGSSEHHSVKQSVSDHMKRVKPIMLLDLLFIVALWDPLFAGLHEIRKKSIKRRISHDPAWARQSCEVQLESQYLNARDSRPSAGHDPPVICRVFSLIFLNYVCGTNKNRSTEREREKRREMEIGNPSPSLAPESHLSPSHQSQSKNKPGGWRAIAYILGNESFEKLASMSLVANITVYLRTKYNLSGIVLVNVVTIWSGTSNVSSIFGAIVSDAYLGRFLTLLFGTVFSLLGMAAMTLTARIPELRPPPCEEQLLCIQPHKWQLAFLFTSLGLIAMGAGGIRPCNIAFGADQFDTNTEKGRTQLESFFNWWYFSFTIALVIALTGVVYIQTNVSWVIGFAIPTACLATSITIFLIGRHTYVYKMPQGSVFLDMAKVMAAAFEKRKIKWSNELCYYDPPGDVEWENRKPFKIDRFKWLDRAAVITNPGELDSQGLPVSTWRLCSVQQVENLKCLLGIIPVWIAGVGCFLVMDQQSTFGVLQAIQMDRSIGKHFTIPPGWMGISSMIALSIWILAFSDFTSRFRKNQEK